jgi:hypothetical protein
MDPGSHVGFQISTKNTNLVEDDGRLPMTKAHRGLWPGELKSGRSKLVLWATSFLISRVNTIS